MLKNITKTQWKNITDTDTLLIDEISMISAKTLEQVYYQYVAMYVYVHDGCMSVFPHYILPSAKSSITRPQSSQGHLYGSGHETAPVLLPSFAIS